MLVSKPREPAEPYRVAGIPNRLSESSVENGAVELCTLPLPELEKRTTSESLS